MKRSMWKNIVLVFAVVLLMTALLNSGHAIAAEPASNTSPQEGAGAPGTDSQGKAVQSMPAKGAELDNQALLGVSALASFYNIPGSAFTPTSSATTVAYDSMGCIHATAGAEYLLNAPLDIPPGSQIVLLRLYYYDTSATNDVYGWITSYTNDGTGYTDLVSVPSGGSAGRGSSYGDLNHFTDTYNARYVMNIRFNSASSGLQVCGLRVMYYAPVIYGTFMPSVRK